MNQNTINVIEATPDIVRPLQILKSRTPTINENSSTKPFGSNGGVKFTPTGDAEDKITGPFDVQLTYLEEDGEMVPYIQILDSSVQNATYAGSVYYQNTIKNILPGVLAPSHGWLYLEIDLLNNTATYNIASVVPTYPLSMKKWAYALAAVTVNNNVYSVKRIHLPGNIVMPTFDDGYQGYFKLSFAYETTTDQQTGEVTQTQRVYCSGGSLCVGGQIGTMTSRYVGGNLTSSLKDVILHYHMDLQSDTDSIELVLGTFNAASCNNTATDAYWLVGHASTTHIIQQSHGVPQLFLIGDCES